MVHLGLLWDWQVLRVDRVPCFTALRRRVFPECLHAYALDVFLEKFREHVFFEWLFRIDLFLIA